MSIGIYKITNLINQKIYIGQSIHIEQRWQEHCRNSSISLLASAIKKYGKENFKFEIVEECKENELDEKEIFYIQKYHSMVPNGYNVTLESKAKNQIFVNYSPEQLQMILNDIEYSTLSFSEIAKKYNLNLSMIYYLNRGDYHTDVTRTYPLRQVKDFSKHIHRCIDCGKEISSQAIRCVECEHKKQQVCERPSREILKDMIRNESFEKIGREYGVSGKAITKWCIAYNLPSKKKEIKQYSNEEWTEI